jgi:hypothetical protein
VCKWGYGVAEQARGVAWNRNVVWSVGIGDMSTSNWEYGYGSSNEEIVPRGCTCEHGVEEGRGGVGGGSSVYVRSYGAREHHKEG